MLPIVTRRYVNLLFNSWHFIYAIMEDQAGNCSRSSANTITSVADPQEWQVVLAARGDHQPGGADQDAQELEGDLRGMQNITPCTYLDTEAVGRG